MRFQNKIADIPQIDEQLDQLAQSIESCYLWTHLDGRLIILHTLLIHWDKEKRQLKFRLDKTANHSALKSIKDLNCFHEDLLNIFRCKIERVEKEAIFLTAPTTVLKLADFSASDIAPDAESNDMDKADLDLISQVLQVINTNINNSEAESKEEESIEKSSSYIFAKKPEIKETASSLAFSDKGIVKESSSEGLSESTTKTKRVVLGKPATEPSTYILNEVDTHGVSFQTIVKNEFKVGDSIIVHSILDSTLSSPLSAKISVFNKPSEYAKYWYVEAKFDVSLNSPILFEKPKEKVGLKRQLAQDQYSSEVFYQIEEITTQEVQLIEKRKGEFKVDDKVLISILYGNPLKKPIPASITSIEEKDEKNLVTLRFDH
mgnify:CR=1 FL=1